MNLTKNFMGDNIPKVEVSGCNFFLKNLRDGGSRLEVDLAPEEVPKLMAMLQVINEDQMNNGTTYKIQIKGGELC